MNIRGIESGNTPLLIQIYPTLMMIFVIFVVLIIIYMAIKFGKRMNRIESELKKIKTKVNNCDNQSL